MKTKIQLSMLGMIIFGTVNANAALVHAQWCRAQCVELDPANHMVYFLGTAEGLAENQYQAWNLLSDSCSKKSISRNAQEPMLVSGFFLMNKHDAQSSSYSSFSEDSSNKSGSTSVSALYARHRSKVLAAAKAGKSYSYSNSSASGSSCSYSIDQDLNLSFEFAEPSSNQHPACTDIIVDDSQLIPVYGGLLPVRG